MKNIKLIIVFIILGSCSSAQVTQTVPLGTYSVNKQNGTYFKDLNNEMLNYVGVWNATQNNKKYIFHFVKFTQEYYEFDNDGSYFYEDLLRIKFKVIDLATNSVLYDDTNIINPNDYKIIGLSLKTGGYWYKDEQNCNLDIRFKILPVLTNQNQLKYCYFEYYNANYEGCPYPNTLAIPMFLPKEDMIFTKQ